MEYTKIPVETWSQIQLNAGMLCSNFDPETGTVTGQLAATSGGINFTAVPSFKDYGEDIDNCPKNMMELKKLDSWDIKMSGTFAAINAALCKTMLGLADIDGNKITPRMELKKTDFQDLWLIGDYGTNGFIAIRMMNSLSTGGFAIQTTDKNKGKFAFEFTGHVSMAAQDVVPCEIYVVPGKCALTYDSNGGTGSMTDSNSPYDAGATVTAKENTFTRAGKTFSKWNTAADGSGTDVNAGGAFTITEDTVLYAQWS